MKICSVCRRCCEDTVLACTEENHDALVEARPGGREIMTDYRLDFLLECDALSETYAATNTALDQPCAVKTIDAKLTGIERRVREEFLNEARRAAAIDHPNVVRVYDSGVLESGEFYVVTELIEDQTLRERVNSGGSLSEKDAVTIARQTAEGLEAAHAAGTRHRNLNPANIILTSSPENALLVKIQNFDFGGIAQAAASAVPDSEPHLDWLRYSSPEQCAAQTTDARTDIYSLGVALYEMLGGQPPFDAPDAAELIRRQINDPPPPLKISNYDVRALLTHTLTQALQKNPTRRLPTANAFARQLRHIEQLMTRSAISVQPAERITAPSATFCAVRVAESKTFAAKSGNSSFEEIQPSVQKIVETATINSAKTEKIDLPRRIVHEDSIIETVSPTQPKLISVERKKADDYELKTESDSAENAPAENVPSEPEPIWAEKKEFDYAGFASGSFRHKEELIIDSSEKEEFTVDSSEPESAVLPAANVEETPPQPAKANSSFSYSYGANRDSPQSRTLNRPVLAGAWLAALLVSAIIGVSLNEKFQSAASPPPSPSTAPAPVSESAAVPESEELIAIKPKPEELTAFKPKSEELTLTESDNAAKTVEPEKADASNLEKYTPVKFEKPATATPFRDGKSQLLKEKAADTSKTEQIKIPPDKKLASQEKTADAIKAKQNISPKKPAPKKQITAPTDSDIFKRPRVVENSAARRKN